METEQWELHALQLDLLTTLTTATKIVENAAANLHPSLERQIVSVQWMVKFNAKEGRRHTKYRADLSVEWKWL